MRAKKMREKKQMIVNKIGIFCAALLLVSCATTSTSIAVSSGSEAWAGTVFVSQEAAPADLQYTIMGSVQADAKVGYDRVESLYPLLADEARKIGANAVVSAKGGRRLTAFSWSAAYVDGIAIKVEDPQQIRGIAGSYH
ncbi:MAG: hypothetical protein LBE21_02410 [Pseudomonadales bacterium]|jgi:hypothetical protein|nr:hypothetical protein [Pseudomonadales bacterium]